MSSRSTTSRKQAQARLIHGLLYVLPPLMTTLMFFVLVIASMLIGGATRSAAASISLVSSAAVATAWYAMNCLSTMARQSREGYAASVIATNCLLSFCSSLYVPVVIVVITLIVAAFDWNPAWRYPITVIMSITVPVVLWKWATGDQFPTEILRGTRILTMARARRLAADLRRTSDKLLNWCGIQIPDRFSVGHFLLVGAPGSGKTVSLRMLMQSILPQVRPGSGWRAIIYDAKQDILPILSGMKLSCPVVTLNALDRRGVAWDMAKDIDSYAVALQVAANLVPDEQGHNAFFVKAARDLLAAVMIAFHLHRPGEWLLTDVILTLSDKERAKKLLSLRPETRHIARDYFSRDPRTLANIQQTITAHVSMLRPIAAAWSRAEHRISLRQWVNGEFVLILANDETLRGPLDALNSAILQRLTQLELAQPESRERRSWFFLDEVKEAGKIDCLPRLMTKGRSKGVRCLLAFQTIEGLRSVYGQEIADDITGLCTTKAILRTDSVATAKWAAEVLGEVERREWRYTSQGGPGGRSSSMAEQIVKRESVFTSELMQLPLANSNRFYGYFITPGIGVYGGAIRISGQLCPLGATPNFIPRDTADQYILDDGIAIPEEVTDEHGHEAATLDDLGALWNDDVDGGIAEQGDKPPHDQFGLWEGR
jgi:type IV secretory pathway TraG/TraD family ATPase VirD4